MTQPRRSRLANVPFFRRLWILLLARITPDCDRITQLASQSLDRPLTWKERQQLRWHFMICTFCERYLRQLQTLHRCACQSREFVPRTPELTLSSDDKEKMKAALRGARKQT